MTPLDHIIQSRKSTYPKDFSDTPITFSELQEIMRTVVYAPNHKKTKPWRFHVFQNSAKKQLGEELAKLYKEKTPNKQFKEKKFSSINDKVTASNAVIAIVVNLSDKVPEWEEKSSVAMAVQNLWLKATEMSIGGYWSTPNYANYLSSFLKLDENQECLGLFYLGKVNAPFETRNYPWEDFVEFRIED